MQEQCDEILTTLPRVSFLGEAEYVAAFRRTGRRRQKKGE
jgi:hypothetical protein